MYHDESKYIFDEETAVEEDDYWYITHHGQKLRVRKADGGGHITECGGPCGDIYTDYNGEM